MEAKRRITAWTLGCVAVVVWGLSFVATRYAVREIPPLTLAFLRFLVALVVLWPWVRRSLRRIDPTRAERRDLFLMGLFGVTLAFVFENLGLARTTAAHGSIIVATTPIATAAFEAARDRRLPGPVAIAGLVLAMVGVLLIVGGDASGEAGLIGDLLMVGTVIVWVAYGFLTLRMSRRFPVGAITNVAILWGVVTLAPLALAELAITGIPRPSPGALAAVVALGVLCSALAYVAWNQALTVLGVTATNSLIYGIPVVAVIGAVWLLDEPLTVEIVIGGILVLAGLVAANLRAAPTRAP